MAHPGRPWSKPCAQVSCDSPVIVAIPALMPSGAKTFDERFLAFVDVMGFRSLVDKMAKDSSLFESTRDVLKTVARQARQMKEYRASEQEGRRQLRHQLRRQGQILVSAPASLEMTAFSDCYVLSEKYRAWQVLAAAQALGAHFIEKGIFYRGAVVHGLAFHHEAVLFGPAVIEAYDLETRVAKYPRILVTDAVRDAAWGYHEGTCKGRLFIRDTDGCWFLNVLVPPLSRWKVLSDLAAHRDARRFLRGVRVHLVRHLAAAGHDLRFLSTVRWLTHHFNVEARQHGDVEPIEVVDGPPKR